MSTIPLSPSDAAGAEPADSAATPTVHIVWDGLFEGNVEQFEDCFGGEPGGLSLADLVSWAAEYEQVLRIEITPPSA